MVFVGLGLLNCHQHLEGENGFFQTPPTELNSVEGVDSMSLRGAALNRASKLYPPQSLTKARDSLG
jgi:hypothetical protein